MRALVTHGHFRARDKDAGHAIRSAVAAEIPHCTQTLWIELLPIEALHCGNRYFGQFSPRCIKCRAVLFSHERNVCPSVRPSVKRVDCDKTKECFTQIFYTA